MTLLAAGTAVGSPGLNLGIFAGFVALTFVVLFATARGGHRAAGDYYTGGQAFTRNQLMDLVWRYTFYTDTSTVTVHIRRLRAKIEADPSRPRFIETVWGHGYRFSP